MSPVVRVVAERRDETLATVPNRVSLGLAELVLAARMAGDVPLPIRTEVQHDARDRMSDRLVGTPDEARAILERELLRVDEKGPVGASAGLAERELLDEHGSLHEGVAVALQALAGGPLSVVLDVSAVRRAGEARLRSWFGVRPGLAAQLTTRDDLEVELAWFDPRLWVSQLARAVTVEPWVPAPAPLVVPDYVSLPSELVAGCAKAYRDQRPDLLGPMAVAHHGAVRIGEAREVRVAELEETLALLRTLGGACRGRLRLLTTRRHQPDSRAVSAWLLFDDGWHELRPGRAATSVLRRRDARDLGLFTLPLVEAVRDEAGS